MSTPNSQLPKNFDRATHSNFLLSPTPNLQLPTPNFWELTCSHVVNSQPLFECYEFESTSCIDSIIPLTVAIECSCLWFSETSQGFKMMFVFQWNFTGHWEYPTSPQSATPNSQSPAPNSQSPTPKLQFPKSNSQLPKASHPKKVNSQIPTPNSQLPKKFDPANQPHIYFSRAPLSRSVR